MDNDLVKTASVMVHMGKNQLCDCHNFEMEAEDENDTYLGSIHQVDISTEAWVEMGKPDKITVTVEVGDNLNEAAEMAGFLRTMDPEEVVVDV